MHDSTFSRNLLHTLVRGCVGVFCAYMVGACDVYWLNVHGSGRTYGQYNHKITSIFPFTEPTTTKLQPTTTTLMKTTTYNNQPLQPTTYDIQLQPSTIKIATYNYNYDSITATYNNQKCDLQLLLETSLETAESETPETSTQWHHIHTYTCRQYTHTYSNTNHHTDHDTYALMTDIEKNWPLIQPDRLKHRQYVWRQEAWTSHSYIETLHGRY